MLIKIPKEQTFAGLPLLLAGFVLYVIGFRADINYMVSLSLPVFIGGIIFVRYGVSTFRTILIPLLLFTLIFPIFPIHKIIVPMQIFSAHITADVLRFLGINAFSEGSMINIEKYKLSVAAGCSGMRSLSTLFFTSIIFTYFINARTFKKVIYVFSSIILALVMNILRLSIVGFYALYNGYKNIESFHDNIGIVISIISILLLLFVARFFED